MQDASTTARVPRTIPALVVIWAVAQLVHFLATRAEPMWPENDGDATSTIVETLSVVYRFVVVALVANGLLRRSRFGWILAFVWQGIQAAFGLINLALNDYELEAYRSLGGSRSTASRCL